MDKALKKVPIWIGLFILLLVPNLDAEEFSLAPSNPAFIAKIREIRERSAGEAAVQTQALPGPYFGYIPSPVDRSHLRGQPLPGPQLLTYLLYFDLRSSGDLTPVRDQGTCGACWAFAAYGALESRLLGTTDVSWDFSENNMKNLAGFIPGPCDGGNLEMTAAYLSRWDGPVNESDDPYNANSGYSPPGLPVQKHLQEVLWFPPRTTYLTNDSIKEALTTYGAVFTSMYYSASSFNPAYNAYYDTSGTDPNHGVVIVGWDDTFDRTRFFPPAPGNGAFIVRNSWGSSWGEQGYFYVSYYDRTLGYGDVAVLNDVQPTDNFSRVYQYDPLGLSGFLGFPTTTPTTGWFANTFTAVGKDDLSAVGFYTPTLNAAYQVYVYVGVGFSPISGTLVASKTGTLAYPGYHTVPLTVPRGFKQGQRFAVVVKLTTPGFNFPIPLEAPWPGYSTPTAGPRQSFVSGNGLTWYDITTDPSLATTNVCLKAFTNPDPPPTGSITIKGGDAYTTTATVPVAISFSADTTQMQFSTNGVTWSLWEAVKSSRSLLLPAGDRVKTVTARLKDDVGNVVEASDSIILDTKPPTGAVSINGGAYATTSPTVELALAAADINGIKEMQFSENGITWSTPETYAATRSYTFSSAATGTRKIIARFIDNAGKKSASCYDTIVLAATPLPAGAPGAVTIKNGDEYTIVATVPLTITNLGSWTSMRLSSNGTTWTAWESFKTSRSFTLTAGNGVKTVYSQFRDGAGTPSGLYADTIILDTKAPTGDITINSEAAATGSATVTLSLAAADINGVKEMEFSENGTIWSSPRDTYATTKIFTFNSVTPGTKKVYVRFIDNAGKASLPATDTITLLSAD